MLAKGRDFEEFGEVQGSRLKAVHVFVFFPSSFLLPAQIRHT
jgi:hypothetical protein